ncbi:MAG: ATP-binding protein [Deferrisomatales bacterium]
MSSFESLRQHHEKIVEGWVRELMHEHPGPYAREPEADLRPLVNQAAEAFLGVLEGGAWDDLHSFITLIARKRLSQGFPLSEVQWAFMLYQRVVTPILLAETPAEHLEEALRLVGGCISKTVGIFSDFFQGLHEAFMREQTVVLAREVVNRTRQLSESESKYKSLVEDIRDGYYVIDAGIVVYANRAFCSMHGRTLQETMGLPFLELVAPESREEVEGSWNAKPDHQTSSLVEYLRLHRDGRKLPTEALARFSFYEGKEANLGICRDISERRELERKTREAETLNALAQQAASLAHDIRNPLTAIKMNVQMLAGELKGNPTHRRLLQISQKEVASIERSMEEMMDLARPFRLNREAVAVQPFVSGCVEALRARMDHKGVRASVRMAPDLDRLNMDPHRMEQSLVNLLFNAIEAVPRGGHLYVSCGRLELHGCPWARICVADDGPGIPKELLPYVFDEKHSRRIGLGLDNVKRIVEAHGGAVDVSRRRPRGLRVCLRLPLER